MEPSRSLPTYSLIAYSTWECCLTLAIRRELIFRHDAFEVFGLAFDTISNSSVRLDGQLLNHRISGRLLNGHSSLRSLTQVTNVIFYLVDMGHFSPRSFARISPMEISRPLDNINSHNNDSTFYLRPTDGL